VDDVFSPSPPTDTNPRHGPSPGAARRRLRLLALVVAALLGAIVAPAPAAAATRLVLPDGTARPQPYQSWIDRSLVPTPAGTVTLHLAPCPYHWDGGVACADRTDRAIYLGPGGRSRAVLLHELGHIFDAAVLTDAARGKLAVALGARGAWDDQSRSSAPLELFADAYSVCARHRTIRAVYYASNGYVAGPRQHRRACGLIRAAV
jgi:hypothetical protein